MSTIRELAEALVPVYEHNGWELMDGIPTADYLTAMISGLFTTMNDEEVVETSTGRLKVTRESDEEGGGYIVSIHTPVAWVFTDGTMVVDVS